MWYAPIVAAVVDAGVAIAVVGVATVGAIIVVKLRRWLMKAL